MVLDVLTLILALAGVALSERYVGTASAVIAASLFFSALGLFTTRHSGVSTLIGVLGIVTDVAVLAWMFVVAPQLAEFGYSDHVNSSLKRIGLAMVDYDRTHGRLPPVAISGGKGQQMLSWRVLILPHLGYHQLFQEFRLDEPWSSSHNLKLVSRIPKEYVGYWGGAEEGKTPFQVVVCKRYCLFDESATARTQIRRDIERPLQIMVIETEPLVLWTKPEDTVYAPDKGLPRLGLAKRSYFYAVMSNLVVRRFDASGEENVVQIAITGRTVKD